MIRIDRVHVIGTGLIGTSVGLALTRGGMAVTVEDSSPTAAALARDLGAGDLANPHGPSPDLVVVATPPDVTARVCAQVLTRWPQAVVIDVASVKGVIVDELARLGADLSRFCGSHPMAGRERSGAIAGRADLFHGRAWVLCPTEQTRPDLVEALHRMATEVGAVTTVLTAHDHDAAVAAVSHVPQLASSMVAARLGGLGERAVGLAGQGLRDVTRVAASDPHLWTQILAGNAQAVREVAVALREQLDEVLAALEALSADADAPGARAILAGVLSAGNAGRARLPGKHGAPPTTYATVRVLIPDEPGQLGRLFADIGEIGANIEEFHLDHELGQAFGLAEVDVIPSAAQGLADSLQARGWRLHA